MLDHNMTIDFVNPKNHADIALEQGRLMVSGNLDFNNASRIYHKSLGCMRECAELVFDFGQMESSNSVVLALMVEWLKYGQQHNKPVKFENLSEKIKSIAKVAGLSQL